MKLLLAIGLIITKLAVSTQSLLLTTLFFVAIQKIRLSQETPPHLVLYFNPQVIFVELKK